MWQEVCKLSEVADNALIETTVEAKPVLFVNGATRRLVIPRSCPHMAAELAEGIFDGHVLTCTKHLWQWSIDEGGVPLGEAEEPLLCYEVKEVDGTVFCRAPDELKYEHEQD